MTQCLQPSNTRKERKQVNKHCIWKMRKYFLFNDSTAKLLHTQKKTGMTKRPNTNWKKNARKQKKVGFLSFIWNSSFLINKITYIRTRMNNNNMNMYICSVGILTFTRHGQSVCKTKSKRFFSQTRTKHIDVHVLWIYVASGNINEKRAKCLWRDCRPLFCDITSR